MLPGAQHLQNVHPLVIHFPIAFLIAATLFYFVAWIAKKEDFAKTGFWILLLGALSLAVSVGTGLYAAQGVMVHLSVRQNLLLPHKRLMIFTSAIWAIATIWAVFTRPFPQKGRILFLVLLLAAVATMTIGADYGGRLVYDYNAGGNACCQPIKFNR